MPKVSIVVPIYNAEAYLDECVQSLLAQTYRNIEIILVDDGSQDSCSDMCDAYAAHDSRVYVVHQVNQGVSVARNVGMDIASGEWIVFCDPDDWYEFNAVETMLTHAEKFGSDIAFFGRVRHYNNRTKICPVTAEDTIVAEHNKTIAHTNDVARDVACHAKLLRKSTLDGHIVRFTPGSVIGQDLMFNLKAIQAASRISCGAVCVYHYRAYESSVSQRYRPDVFIHFEKTLKEVNSFTTDFLSPDLADSIYSGWGVNMINSGFRMTFFNKDAPLTLRQRINGMNEIIRKEPWNSIVNSKTQLATTRLRLLRLLQRHRLLLLYYLLRKVHVIQNQLKKS